MFKTQIVATLSGKIKNIIKNAGEPDLIKRAGN